MQDFRPKSFPNDDKLFSRLLSKEKYNSSKQGGGEASFRVLYYGGATGSVPFVWESQPGTPKHTFNDDPLPPLTPPPYYINPKPNNNPLHKKNSKKSKSFRSIIFPRVHSSKKFDNSPSFSPSSSFSSSYSLPSTPFSSKKANKTRSGSSSSSIIGFGFDEEQYEPEMNSPTSTLCFGPRNGGRIGKGYYLYPIKSMKKVVFSIVGHGTAK